MERIFKGKRFEDVRIVQVEQDGRPALLPLAERSKCCVA